MADQTEDQMVEDQTIGQFHIDLIRKLTTDHLHQLKNSFPSTDEDGQPKIGLEEFRIAFQSILGKDNVSEEQATSFFRKMDPYCFDKITWLTFVTFVRQYNRFDNMVFRLCYRAFRLPPTIRTCVEHNDTTVSMEVYPQRCGNVDYVDGTCVSASRNGYILFWNQAMQVVSKNPIDPYFIAVGRASPLSILDMVCLPDVGMLAVTTTNWDIRFFDSTPSDFQRHFSFTEFPRGISSLDYHVQPRGSTSSLLIAGDEAGVIYVIWMEPSFFLNMRMSLTLKQKLSHILLSHLYKKLIGGINLIEIQNVHLDTISMVRYLPSVNSIVSCSPNNKVSLAAYEMEQDVYMIYKSYRGILCFAYCESNDWIVTGGLDCCVRIWSRMGSDRPSRVLIGHTNAITHIQVDELRLVIMSFSQDKQLRCWNLLSGDCMQQIDCRYLGLGVHDVTCLFYNPVKRTLYVHTAKFANFQAPLDSDVQTHNKPVVGVLYSAIFESVVTGSEDSEICVWDLKTGTNLFGFCDVRRKIENQPLTEYPAVLSAMSLDYSQRRLLTGSDDGYVKYWNFNTGICLKVFGTPGNQRINAFAMLDNMVYAVGRNKRVINMYDDGVEDFQRKWKVQHKMDIMTVGIFKTGYLVTASGDGEIIIWIKEAALIRCRLTDDGSNYNEYRKVYKPTSVTLDNEQHSGIQHDDVSKPPEVHDEKDALKAISKLLFIQSRQMKKEVASMVTAGKNGVMRMWSICPGSGLLGRFSNTNNPMIGVMTMITDPKDQYLITGDTTGYIRIWQLTGYCNPDEEIPESRFAEHLERFPYLRLQTMLEKKGMKPRQYDPEPSDPELIETKPPLLLNRFRAHLESVNSVSYVPSRELILTGSYDGNVRLWELSGSFVGQFGHGDAWDLATIKPLAPGCLRKMPPEVRRMASPTTLKVFNHGYCPRWEKTLKVIRRCRRKKILRGSPGKSTEKEVSPRQESMVAERESPILGKFHEITELPVPHPKISDLYTINFKVLAFSELKVGELDERPPMPMTENICQSLVRSGYITHKPKNKSKKKVHSFSRWKK